VRRRGDGVLAAFTGLDHDAPLPAALAAAQALAAERGHSVIHLGTGLLRRSAQGKSAVYGDDPVSVYFTWVNAGKRSISLDLRTERGAALARELALASDVVLENFRPGALEKYGLDAAALRATKPALIYCSVNGWGGDNSWSQRRVRRWCRPRSGGWSSARLHNAPRPTPTSTETSRPVFCRSPRSSAAF
jgi:crotonobetainyl-CoA:carnitine CoA-transferase CaiB-like acyl-CoA transferase